MAAIAIIVFREVLEAALIVGIVLAATRGVPRRGLTVILGIVGGLLGASVVAAFTGEIASALEGNGQEIFNAAVLFTAVAMLGWHNVWMNKHGRELVAGARGISDAVRSGSRPLYALGVVVGVAVLREGSEVVLFVYGIAAAQGTAAMSEIGGCLVGLVAGAAMGALIYGGLVTIPMRYLFAVTSWLILLLAAGMASQGAAFLVQADLLPPLGTSLWDTSWLLSETSILGKTLQALVGYVSNPSGIQLVFYFGTIVIIGGLMLLQRSSAARPARAAAE